MHRPPRAPGPATPDPTPIREVLDAHGVLARLGELLRDSRERYELIRPVLPGALTRFVQPGPVDEEGWSLLAANAAVAAKLRHLQPRLEALLAERGIQPSRVRIKVQG